MKTPKIDSQNFLKSDRSILILCIGLSLIFWLFTKLSKSFTTKSEVSIEYILPSGKIFEEEPTKVVTPTYTGQGWDLVAKSIRKTEPKIYIELTEETEQSFSQSQLKSWIENFLPNKDIKISSIDYDRINVNLIDEHSKVVPVIFEQKIAFKDNYGFYKDSILLSPDSVTITGPKDKLDTFDAWPTSSLISENAGERIRQKVEVATPKAHNLTVKPKVIDVSIPVEQFTEKSFLVNILAMNSPADSVKIFPRQVKLSCVVGLSKYDTLKHTDFKVGIDLKEAPLNSENNFLPISIFEAPSYVRNTNLNHKSVEFFILQDTLITQKK